MIALPAGTVLVPESHIVYAHVPVSPVLQSLDFLAEVLPPYPWRRCAVAYQLGCQQMVRYAAQIVIEPGHLTRSPGKQHLPSLFEGFPYLAVAVLHPALKIF